MRGYTWGVIPMRRRVVQRKASKQKLNTESSADLELVGASDYII